MRPTAHVHLLSADRNALLDVVERAETTFLEFGVAPERRTTAVDPETARQYATADPATTDGAWLPYLSTATVDAAAEDGADLHHAGITGMTVVGRLLREEVEGHPAVYLQSDDRSAGVRTGYAVYRYAGPVRGYECLHRQDGAAL